MVLIDYVHKKRWKTLGLFDRAAFKMTTFGLILVETKTKLFS